MKEKWTPEDSADATAEGWDVFEEDGAPIIQRIDDFEDGSAPVFPSDMQAVYRVYCAARGGDALAAKAMRVTLPALTDRTATDVDQTTLLSYLLDPTVPVDKEHVQALTEALNSRRELMGLPVMWEVAMMGHSAHALLKQKAAAPPNHPLPFGTKVKWHKSGGKYAGYHTGKVIKKNSKNYKVLSDDNLKWNIHPSKLQVLP